MIAAETRSVAHKIKHLAHGAAAKALLVIYAGLNSDQSTLRLGGTFFRIALARKKNYMTAPISTSRDKPLLTPGPLTTALSEESAGDRRS